MDMQCQVCEVVIGDSDDFKADLAQFQWHTRTHHIGPSTLSNFEVSNTHFDHDSCPYGAAHGVVAAKEVIGTRQGGVKAKARQERKPKPKATPRRRTPPPRHSSIEPRVRTSELGGLAIRADSEGSNEGKNIQRGRQPAPDGGQIEPQYSTAESRTGGSGGELPRGAEGARVDASDKYSRERLLSCRAGQRGGPCIRTATCAQISGGGGVHVENNLATSHESGAAAVQGASQGRQSGKHGHPLRDVHDVQNQGHSGKKGQGPDDEDNLGDSLQVLSFGRGRGRGGGRWSCERGGFEPLDVQGISADEIREIDEWASTERDRKEAQCSSSSKEVVFVPASDTGAPDGRLPATEAHLSNNSSIGAEHNSQTSEIPLWKLAWKQFGLDQTKSARVGYGIGDILHDKMIWTQQNSQSQKIRSAPRRSTASAFGSARTDEAAGEAQEPIALSNNQPSSVIGSAAVSSTLHEAILATPEPTAAQLEEIENNIIPIPSDLGNPNDEDPFFSFDEGGDDD